MACSTFILHSFPSNPPNPRKFISSSSLPTSHLKASFRDRAFHTSHFKCFSSRRDEISSSSSQSDEGPSEKAIIPGKRTVWPTNLLEQYQFVHYLKLPKGVTKFKDQAVNVAKEAVNGVTEAMKWIGGVQLVLFTLHMHADGFYM